MWFEGTGARHPLPKHSCGVVEHFEVTPKTKPSISGSFINHHNTGFQTAIFISPLGLSQDEEEVHEERQEFGAQLRSSAGDSQQTPTASASATRPWAAPGHCSSNPRSANLGKLNTSRRTKYLALFFSCNSMHAVLTWCSSSNPLRAAGDARSCWSAEGSGMWASHHAAPWFFWLNSKLLVRREKNRETAGLQWS